MTAFRGTPIGFSLAPTVTWLQLPRHIKKTLLCKGQVVTPPHTPHLHLRHMNSPNKQECDSISFVYQPFYTAEFTVVQHRAYKSFHKEKINGTFISAIAPLRVMLNTTAYLSQPNY